MMSKDVTDNVKGNIADRIFYFIRNDDNEKLAHSWLKSGFIHPKGDATKKEYVMSKS